ncbi:MAG: O-antigen ligase family protein, partial [Deltaproteobacteria bacterium]|nr:O-antigen ligase family protein [Deltaproteobacteria bacterium]
ASGTFIVFSNLIFGYGQIISPEIVFIYILPWLILCAFLYFGIFLSKTYRIEIILMSLIIIMGIINVYTSDNIYQSSIWMRMFLLSGIILLWTSMFIITEERSRNYIYYLSCGLLFVIAIIEIANYFITGSKLLSMNHPIPLGTLVILLMVGPLFMLASGQKRMKLFSIFLVIMGLILLVIANKRGIYLAIAGMTAAWIYYRYIRTSIYAIIILLICLTLLAVGWNYHKLLDKNIPSHNSILHRLELYPFSLHIYQKHPLLGTGLRAFSHESYLTDYQVHNKSLDTFKKTAIKLQTLDNMILTGFVELGSIMTICYLGLILYIIVRYCHITQPFSLNHKKEFVLLLPLLGLAIHSMTYDSLIFPQINWLFHVQLGILAGFSKAEPQGPASPMPVA